ncbi:hypothetical protein OCA23_27255 [Bacillus cereus]|nr:hypothetical protein [Bacillus cereus]
MQQDNHDLEICCYKNRQIRRIAQLVSKSAQLQDNEKSSSKIKNNEQTFLEKNNKRTGKEIGKIRNP